MGALLRSGFGSGVTLSAPLDSPGTTWYHTLNGGDADGLNSFDDWPGLDAGTGMRQQTFIDEGKVFTDYLVTELRDVIGPRGVTTKVLYHQMIQDDIDTGNTSRSQWVNQPGQTRGTPWHIRYDLMLNTETPTRLAAGSDWYMLTEIWWDQTSIAFRANWDGGEGKMIWKIDRKVTNIWEVLGTVVRVPLGEWFKFDVFMWDSLSDGTARIFMNNELAASYRGNTDLGGAIDRLQSPKCYTGGPTLAAGPLDQHIDNFELHDSWDSGTCPAMDHPVRGHPIAAVAPVGTV